MTRLTPDPEILALAESDAPDCGKEFNPGLCRTRHLAAKAREARNLEYGLCAYCPLILKHLGIVTKSADSDTPTCATCGNTLTKNGFCHSCRSTAQQAREAEKRQMCKTCGKCRAKDGFEYCSYCLKHAGRLKFKLKLEEPKTMTTTENKPEAKPLKKRSATCKQCGKPCTFNESGLCRPCSAARNARKAREAKPLSLSESTQVFLKSSGDYYDAKIAAVESQRCPKCGKKLTKNGFCYTCAAYEREAKKSEARKPVCKKTAPKVTQATLDMPDVGTCPEPAADTIHAASLDASKVSSGSGSGWRDGIIEPTITPGLARYKQPESIYRRALRHYGDRNQILKAAEEASELSAAIMRYLSMQGDNGMSPVISLVEELADVEIMCQQMRLVFGDQPIDAAKRQKLERLERRLDE